MKETSKTKEFITATVVGKSQNKIRTRPEKNKINHRLDYAPAIAPWTRPEAVLEDDDSGDEDHETHGAFRITGSNPGSDCEEDGKTVDLVSLAEQLVHGVTNVDGYYDTGSVILVENDDGEGGWNEERGTRDMLLQLQKMRSKRNLP